MIETRTLARTGALTVALGCAAYAVTADRGPAPAPLPEAAAAAPAARTLAGPPALITDVRPTAYVRPAPAGASNAPSEAPPAELLPAALPGEADEVPPLPAPVPLAGSGCDAVLTAEPGAMGTALLSLDAPCHAGTVATFQHEALEFTLALDGDGAARVRVPALRADSAFFVFLDDGTGAMAEATVTGTEGLLRVAALSAPDAGAALHAFEAGAEFGAPGHLLAGSEPADGATGAILRLGDGAGPAPRVAEVYQRLSTGAPSEVILEFAVSDATCARDLTAVLLRQDGAAPAEIAPVSVRMPDCDGEGGFVALNAGLEGPMLALD